MLIIPLKGEREGGRKGMDQEVYNHTHRGLRFLIPSIHLLFTMGRGMPPLTIAVASLVSLSDLGFL